MRIASLAPIPVDIETRKGVSRLAPIPRPRRCRLETLYEGGCPPLAQHTGTHTPGTHTGTHTTHTRHTMRAVDQFSRGILAAAARAMTIRPRLKNCRHDLLGSALKNFLLASSSSCPGSVQKRKSILAFSKRAPDLFFLFMVHGIRQDFQDNTCREATPKLSCTPMDVQTVSRAIDILCTALRHGYPLRSTTYELYFES